ncbi:hypothetical protein HYR99_24430 [Candidatus Poribacteria bacterium]|nr:hypothetical protein [Candidatus Poribacteria bacterium]
MKLKWLDNLHRLYSFVQDDQRYVVDLDRGEFFPIDEVVWEILQRCPSPTLSDLLDSLKPLYAEGTIFEGLKKISQFSQMGYLLEGRSPHPVEQDGSKRKRLFWMRHVIYPHPPPQSGSVAWSHYQLIRTLAQYADICLHIPKGAEEHLNFGEDGIQKVPVNIYKRYSPSRYVTEGDYDGILALSIGYGDDLPFFSAPCPVLARANSAMIDVEKIINGILAKYGLLRRWDALIADASYVVEGYAQILGNREGFEVIPDGIDELEMPRWEGPIIEIGRRPDNVKTFLASQFGWTELESRPIVGLIFGTLVEEHFPMALRISHRYPKWNFLMLEETSAFFPSQLPENLRIFRAFRLGKDPNAEAITFVLKSINVLYFNAVLGSPPTWLWRAMAAGVPLVVTSYAPVPEVGEASRFIPLERRGCYRTRIPMERVTGEIEALLNQPQGRAELSVAGHKVAKAFTWDNTAERFLLILDELTQKQKALQARQRDPYFPSLFVRQYDKGKARIYSQTLRLPSRTPESLESGLARELLRNHNTKEVQGVLKALGKANEAIEGMFSDL